MRAVVCRALGPPSLLSVEEQPDPVPTPSQVLVEVEAAGVNFVDGLFIAGQYQIKPPLPFTPGSEIAGRVTVVGSEVDGFETGQRVIASTGLGGYASQVAVSPHSLALIPDRLDAARAATLTQSYCTCLFALGQRAQVRPDETVLVLGAGGGIGLAAIAVARALGGRVIGAASSAAKRAAALEAGAEAVIDSTTESIKDRTRTWAGGTGVDMVIDPIGGPAAEPSLRALGDGGRYLVIGFASGAIPSLPLNQVLLRNRAVHGIDWGVWAMQHGAAQQALLRDLLSMVGEDRISPVHPTTYPLEQVGTALEDLLARRVVGKIALIP
jgi:NADPH2:quinone reductase